jgi:hypothetical protein
MGAKVQKLLEMKDKWLVVSGSRKS